MTVFSTIVLSPIRGSDDIFDLMKIHASTDLFKSCVLGVAGIAILVMTTATANAAVGYWNGEGNARVRLLATSIDTGGQIDAGIEIVLDPGWKTYWRNPGDAGIAPLVDFSASANIGSSVELAFPVPHRYDDGYAVTNVYQDHVVLPVKLSRIDNGAAATISLSLDIGVCAEICVPEHYDLSVELAPGETDGEALAILAEAAAHLPMPPIQGSFAVDGIARAGGADKRPVFEINVVAPDAAGAEVYIEGPDDWYPGPPKLVSSDDDRATFSVEFSRLGSKTPIGGNAFTVTIVSAGKAVEDVVTLDWGGGSD